MLKPLSIEPREEHDDTSHQHKVGVVGICVSTVNGLFIKGTMFKKFEIRSKHMPPLRWKLLRENSTSRARARGKGTTRDPVACLQKRLRCRKCNRCKRDSERKIRRANSEMWIANRSSLFAVNKISPGTTSFIFMPCIGTPSRTAKASRIYERKN